MAEGSAYFISLETNSEIRTLIGYVENNVFQTTVVISIFFIANQAITNISHTIKVKAGKARSISIAFLRTTIVRSNKTISISIIVD